MQTAHDWLPWLPTGAYLAGALCCARSTPSGGWRVLALSTRLALGAAILSAAIALPAPSSPVHQPASDAAALVTVLVSFLGWIIGDYSHRYLRGEPAQRRFTIPFLATLAGAAAVIASPDLLILVIAWAGGSAGLHQLLTFYRDRPAAIVVAHKKFLASRLAEACLIVSAVLLYREWGTLDLTTISARAAAGTALPGQADIAAALIAVAVLIKCAQLPLHGWLIQVMEAPTPVSALLHAGVVNLGGLVLIRLGPLIGASATAQTLLVVVGSLTAALAGLVMLTRVTIKVRLAWSTCSQMGLMVMECGLGLYDLALLHLLAHALYKAHAFLTAGEAVRASLERAIVTSSELPTPVRTFLLPTLALAVAALIAAASATAWHRALGVPAIHWVNIAFLSCGLATLLWRPIGGRRFDWRAALGVGGATQLYLVWHWLLSDRLGVVALPPSTILATGAVLVLVALYFTQSWAVGASGTAFKGRVYDWIYAGFYLDERFTRLTFRVWPPGVPSTGSSNLAERAASSSGRTK